MSASSVSRELNYTRAIEELSRQHLELVENQQGLSKTQEEFRNDQENLRTDQQKVGEEMKKVQNNLKMSNDLMIEELTDLNGRVKKLEESNCLEASSTTVFVGGAPVISFVFGVAVGVSLVMTYARVVNWWYGSKEGKK